MQSRNPMFGLKKFEVAGLDDKTPIPDYTTDYAFADDPMNYGLKEMTPLNPEWTPQGIPLMEADEKK